MRMRPFDRVLCVTAGLFGIAAFGAGIYSRQPVEIGVRIGALVVGLTTVSLVIRR